MTLQKLTFICLAAFGMPVTVFSTPSSLASQKGGELSQSRLQSIQKIVVDYKKAGERLSDPGIQRQIFNDISKIMPLVPKNKPDVRDKELLADEARDVVARKFPESAESIRKDAERIAADKFVMHAILDYVTVRSQKGDDSYTAEGVFYGYGANSIKVGDRFIAIFDLLPECRIKFDKAYNEQKRREFIEGRVQSYFAKKNQYSHEVFKQLREEQAKKNEETGYINAWKEWRTARDVAEILIATEMSKGKGGTGRTPEDVLNMPPNAAALQNEDPSPVETVQTAMPQETPYPAAARRGTLDELMKKVRKRLGDIADSCSGIDADQGYRTALWGFTREEIGLILPNEGIALTPTGTSDTIMPKDGPTKRIELQYHHNYLVRINVWFHVAEPKDFTALCNKLIETYGRTDEERTARQETEARVDSAEKADGKRDRKEEKKDDSKKELPPMEQAYHWTGRTTTGTIYIKLNKERSAAEEVRLTKECPALIQSLAEEERRLKEEARNNRRTETIDYKRKIDF